MLDDKEFERIVSLRGAGTGDLLERYFGPMLREYERITGFRETNHNALYHHKLSLYGPPCRHCAKPLRTNRARLCGACMMPVGKGRGIDDAGNRSD